MPAHILKLRSGKRITLKAIRLPNGNLLVRGRSPTNRKTAEWHEAVPGTSLYKRWLPMAVDEPDPRLGDTV